MAQNGPVSTIELLQSQSLSNVVRRELERRILGGAISPGQKLTEADVAEELRVSRGPVREAFRALESAGLLRTEKNRGVFVRELSAFEADELYEVRAGLDALIGRLAAERASAAQVRQLRALDREMRATGRTGDVDAYYPLNLRFHDLLAQLSGNATLLATYRRLVNELHLYRRETLAHGPDSFPTSASEHHAIVDAIASRDADGAARLLYQHVMESRARLHRTLDRSPAGNAATPRRKKKS